MGKFTFTQTEIPGVVVIEPQVFGDDRGYFMETYQKDQFAEAGIDKEFVQDNQSRSTRGVLRGLHFQKNHTQGKLVRVTKGEVYDVAGTASIFSCVTDRYAPDLRHKTLLFTRSAADGLWNALAYISGGGMCLHWYRKLSALTYKELDEAAKIDGCSYWGIFTRIMIPLIKPAVVTGCIFSFMWRWDDFLSALLYINKTAMYPVSLALKLFCDPGSSSDYGAMFAMASLSILPSVLIFIFFQKCLIFRTFLMAAPLIHLA